MFTNSKRLANLQKLSEEINQQLYTPNRYESLEDVFEYGRSGHQSFLEYHIYKKLNEKFAKLLEEFHCDSVQSLPKNAQQLFKDRMQSIAKEIRDDMVRTKTFVSYFYEKPIDNDDNFKEKDHLSDGIKEYLSLNIDTLMADLFSGKKLAIANKEFEEHFKAGDVLTDFRKHYHDQRILPFTLDSEDDEQELKAKLTKINHINIGLYLNEMQYKVGQCGEHVDLAIYKLLSERILDFDDTIEVIEEEYGSDGFFEDNHVHLVINRDPNSDINDIRTWGNNAIVFDSWKQSVYMAGDYLSHRFIEFGGDKRISNIIKFDSDDRKLLRKVRSFNKNLTISGHLSKEQLTTTLIVENKLVPLSNPEFIKTNEFLQKLLQESKPDNFPATVNLYLTSNPQLTIEVIPGFQNPTIAINQDLLQILLNENQGIEQIKFALSNALFSIKHHGIGLQTDINAYQQFELDRNTLIKHGNGDAAIAYLRLIDQFEKNSNAEEGPVKIPNFYRLSFTDLPASNEQRIKNITTYLAQEHNDLPQPMAIDYDVSEIQEELASITPIYFYANEFHQLKNCLGKIQYLTSQLNSLKENELLAYEQSLTPSARLREFCQLIKQVPIDFNDSGHIAALDQLINQALELRIPGFDRIYYAIFHKTYYISSYGEPRDLKPLGVFRDFGNCLRTFTHAKDIDSALQISNIFLSLYFKLETHFHETNLQTVYKEYLSEFKKMHQNQLPLVNERFFGSRVGAEIEWPGFDEDADITQFINWGLIDKTGTIATTLMLLGFNDYYSLLQNVPRNIIKTKTNKECSTNLVVKHNIDISKYSSGNERKSLKKFLSVSHQLAADMFDTDLPFEEKLKLFFDANMDALRNPYYNRYSGLIYKFNTDNEVVHFLLKQFATIALTGSKSEKAVVKSFFLGRNDKKDLLTLTKDRSYYSELLIESPYLQFALLQQYQNKSFQLFNQEEMIDLIKKYDVKMDLSFEFLMYLYGLPYKELSLVALEVLMPKMFEADIIVFHTYDKLIKEHLKKFGPYTSFSSETMRLFKLLTKTEAGSELITEILKNSVWEQPTYETLKNFDIKDLILMYRTYEGNLLFNDFSKQQQFGTIILQLIEDLKNVDEKIVAIEALLISSTSQPPLSDIPLRNELIDLLAKLVVEKHGCDDESDSYFNSLRTMIDRFDNSKNSRDKIVIFSKLATAINSQNRLSEYIGLQLEPEKYLRHIKKVEQKTQGRILSNLASAAAFLGDNQQDREAALKFITEPLTDRGLNDFANYLVSHNKALKFQSLIGYHSSNKLEPPKLKASLFQFYQSFWDRNLTERAVLIDYLIIPPSKMLDERQIKDAYEQSFAYVINKLFPNAHIKDSDDEFAASFLRTYLNEADQYTRSILLAGILVVSNEITNEQQNISVGRKLAMLCEHMGPAYVKLAQAIHSHPATPPHIREDLKHVKGRANPPHRWELWRLISSVLPDAELKQIKKVGKLIGSASYNLAIEVTLTDGREVVLLLLRENAEQLAREGFKQLKATFAHCPHPRMQAIRTSMMTTLQEAELLSEAEMNYQISDQQNKIAQKLYQLPMQVTVDNTHYQVLMMPAYTFKSGLGYRFIERIYGEEFNDLPVITNDDKKIKKAIAIAVITVELLNLLHGNNFDSDRHGNQLRALVDSENKTIYLGLYDFGEMSITPPTDEELKQLGDVIQDIFRPLNLLWENQSVDNVLSKHFHKALEQDKSGRFLMRIRKAFLALQDFQQHLSRQEMLDILQQIVIKFYDSIHPVLQPSVDKAKLMLSFKHKIEHGAETLYNFFHSKKHPVDNSPMDADIRPTKHLKTHQ